jgi:hypothetical protein
MNADILLQLFLCRNLIDAIELEQQYLLLISFI